METSSRHARRRILFVHSSDELYGSDTVLLRLVCGLDRRQFEPIVALPSDLPYEGRLSRMLEERGIAHRSINMGVIRRCYLCPSGVVRYAARLLCGTWQLSQLIRQQRVDVVHSSTSAVVGGALAARLHHLPHVWHIHEILEQPAWLSRLVAGLVLANSTRVVAVSQAVANHLARGRSSAAVQVIPNGVDRSAFGPHVDGRPLRQVWNIGDGEVAIGVVGRLSHWKGQELFLRAAAGALRTDPCLRFVVVGSAGCGDGGRLGSLLSLARHLGIADSVTFVPFTTAVPQVMRALDVAVLPSTLPEPFGLVILEAMASERPVIAAAHGGPLEIVRHGETGLLFSPGDADALSAAMLTLARDPELAARMGQAGRRRAAEHFPLSRFSRSFSELYDELLAGQPLPGRTAQWVSKP